MDIIQDIALLKLSKNPMGKVETALTKLMKTTDWPDNIKAALTPRDAGLLLLYGFPKIHKEACPGPLVNMIGIPTYDITKYLAGLLKPQLGQTDAYVKNSTVLAQILDTVIPVQGVSLDVVSLFTNVPVEPTMKLIQPLFRDLVVKLFEYILRSICFVFDGVF